MNRPLTFLCALAVAAVTVSSACIAQSSDVTRFTLDLQRDNSAKVHATFHDQGRDDHDNNWSTDFPVAELTGLEVSTFRAAGSRPVHFAIVREAGRLDCAGNGGSGFATGNCRFTENGGFSQLLASRGIGRPTRKEAFGLMAVNARRDVIDAVAAAHYPTPSINNLMALSALGVDGRYIGEMSHAGYRPRTVQSLIEYKALGISPEWIAGFQRVGYASLPGDGLVQLKALGITPDYIAGFQRIGYRNLPVDTLVQLKALDITPEFVRAVANGGAIPPVSKLAELKMFGSRH